MREGGGKGREGWDGWGGGINKEVMLCKDCFKSYHKRITMYWLPNSDFSRNSIIFN